MFRRFSESLAKTSNAPAPAKVEKAGDMPSLAPKRDGDGKRDLTELKVRFHQKLLDILNLSVLDKIEVEQLQREVGSVVRELLVEEGVALNGSETAKLVDEILDEVLGLGPLEPLLKDITVSDILVNTHEQVFVERHGRLQLTNVRFKDDRHLLRIIEKIVSRVGRRVDESQPWVDARLPDGSRVNAIIPPCAIDGPLLSIRKFSRIPYNMDRLVEMGSLTEQMAELLHAVVRCRLNVLISGGTGSGKTTMLNSLSSYISNDERICTIEDAAELQLQQTHTVRMETRPANVEGKGAVSQRDLLRNALRMRPDRIIVGEVRGGEVIDMLQAMNTGHEGSMTTVHANSARDALSRLEQMLGMTGFVLPERTMRAQMASGLHVILQLNRMSDGARRVTSIQEIVGIEGDIITMQEIYTYVRTGVDENGKVLGYHTATGIRPKFSERLAAWGIRLSTEMFTPQRG